LEDGSPVIHPEQDRGLGCSGSSELKLISSKAACCQVTHRRVILDSDAGFTGVRRVYPMHFRMLCLGSVLLTTFLAIPQSALAEAAASANVANVYIQAKSGVYVFHAKSSGQLDLVSGSPFADSGQMEAVRGNNLLISVGTNYLHSYALLSNGGVGRQLAQVNTAAYGGSKCGNTDQSGSILDHTGQYFSVQLYGTLTNDGNNYQCGAWQTYKVASDGQFTFLGDWENTGQYQYELSPLPLFLTTVSSNNEYIYGALQDPDGDSFIPFKRASAGDIVQNGSFTEVDPTPEPGSGQYSPEAVAADSANHLAALLIGGSPAPQLASYTVDNANGSIKSTNTWKNMPTVDNDGPMAMSPAGNLIAIAAKGETRGVQLFHFNGAAPATSYTGILPDVEIDQVAWDKNGHLYALNYTTGKLYVYTVTPTSVKPVPGGTYSVPGAVSGSYYSTGFVVVPQS
jgi:hypothetical protein